MSCKVVKYITLLCIYIVFIYIYTYGRNVYISSPSLSSAAALFKHNLKGGLFFHISPVT